MFYLIVNFFGFGTKNEIKTKREKKHSKDESLLVWSNTKRTSLVIQIVTNVLMNCVWNQKSVVPLV